MEIDMASLENNVTALRKLTNAKICAVVKADVYGHGLGAINALNGADEFAVSSIGEAAELREKTDKAINILSLPDRRAEGEYSDKICPTLASESDIEWVRLHGAKSVNIKLNTGMNRYGAPPDDLGDLLRKTDFAGLTVKSVFSHIYDISAAQRQFELFDAVTRKYLDYIPCRHIASGNFVRLPEYMHLDMVRPGLVMYGYGHENVRPAVKLGTTVTQLRKVRADDNVGYGISPSGRVRELAVIGAGYGDGIRRITDFSPRYASLGGNLCRFVGQICMDASLIDVGGLDARVGDVVYLTDEAYTLQAFAAACGTICYEILTGITKRAKREYIQKINE